MKCALKFSFTVLFAVLFAFAAFGQFNARKYSISNAFFVSEDHEQSTFKRWSLPGLSPDKQSIVYKPAAPLMTLPVNTAALQGDSYWMGSVTSQSYNQGKIGRFYYWDIQGNLRGSYLFFDIAGKNKRGLKLVFPKHRALF